MGGRRDVLPFADEKLDGSDSESEEDLEPWHQPVEGDAPPASEAEAEGNVAVDRSMPEATVPRQERRAEVPVLEGVGLLPPRKGVPPAPAPGPGGDGDLLIDSRNFHIQGHENVHPQAMARSPPYENRREPIATRSSGASSTTGASCASRTPTRRAGHTPNAPASNRYASESPSPSHQYADYNPPTGRDLRPPVTRILVGMSKREFSQLKVGIVFAMDLGMGKTKKDLSNRSGRIRQG